MILIQKRKRKKNALYLSVNVFGTKVLIGETIFYVSNWRWGCHFTWSSEPHEGLAGCSAKRVPSFLNYFKTLSIGPGLGIEPTTSRSAVNTLHRLHCRGYNVFLSSSVMISALITAFINRKSNLCLNHILKITIQRRWLNKLVISRQQQMLQVY